MSSASSNALTATASLLAGAADVTTGEAAAFALGYSAASSGNIPASDTAFGPIAEQRQHKVLFGEVAGEDRSGDTEEGGKSMIKPAISRDDPWFWLRDDTRKSKDVLGHLEKENAFSKAATANLDPFRKTLFEEHKGHLKETDAAPAYRYDDFFYYTRTVEGQSYRLHCRKAGTAVEGGELTLDDAAEEQLLLDENKLADGKKHCDVGRVKPSPDHTRLAFTADYSGNETYSVSVLDIATGTVLGDEIIKDCAGSMTWGRDFNTIYYTTEDDAKRPYKVWRHKVGSSQSEDVCVFTDEDDQYYVGMGKSKDGRFVYICSGSSETTEWLYIDLTDDAQLMPKMIQPRRFKLKYDVSAYGDNFLVITNKDDAVEMQLMYTPIATPGEENWKPLIPHKFDRTISDVEIFSDYAVLEGREQGLTQIWVMDIKEGADGKLPDPETIRQLKFKDDLFEASVSTNMEFNTKKLRIVYSSLATPVTWYDVDMAMPQGSLEESMAALTVVKAKEVLNFDGRLYETKRLFATAPDKTKIPMSLVYRKDLYDGGERKPVPAMLYGYGSYGICIDPGFDAKLLPYLDRGMVYAIAHVRGGGEMGRFWYEDQGKYHMKRNTFTDFNVCAEHLIAEGFTTADTLAIEGRSAGGLLMGAVINMRPDLYQVCVAGVPFVDVMNTMSDPSIPLTSGEWEEWGNPNEHKYHDYMLSYSPYDNIRAQPYPNILITAGLHDPRVAYWEPAKWASKVRSLKTNGKEVMCKFDLDSGHFSASDRYKYLREKAWEQAYVLDKIGLKDAVKRSSTLE